MAEATKPTKSIPRGSKSARTNESRQEDDLSEITDKNLEKRLKSLTSFINNIEPTPKQTELPQTVQESSKVSF